MKVNEELLKSVIRTALVEEVNERLDYVFDRSVVKADEEANFSIIYASARRAAEAVSTRIVQEYFQNLVKYQREEPEQDTDQNVLSDPFSIN